MPSRKQPSKIDPILLGRLLKQRKATGLVIVLAIIVAVAILDHGAGLLPVQDDWHKYHGQTFEVLRVVDGDTLELRVPDGDRKTTSVRLWGVDTPEMGRADRGTEPRAFAEEATAFVRRNTEGQRVTLTPPVSSASWQLWQAAGVRRDA